MRFIRKRLSYAVLAPVVLAILASASMTARAQPSNDAAHLLDGGALYKQNCASCHDAAVGAGRAPPRSALARLTPNEVFDTLSHGAMAKMASGLSDPELDAIAFYLTGKAPAHAAAATAASSTPVCKTNPAPTLARPRWNGWSPTLNNARFQAQTALDARTVARLEPKWAFQFTGGLGSQPTVVGGRIFFATGSGAVYALDAGAGCQHWRAEVKGGVRAAVTVAPLSGGSGRLAVFIGDRTGGVHALDAATGQEIWTTKVDSHPFATITAAPALYRGRIYVPVSSSEEISSLLKGYHCCTFRGHVTALDAATGKVLWTTYTIPETPEPYRLDPKGGQLYGPAGAAIWSSPTIDARRGALYVATGDSYSDAPNTGSDAVMAMDLVTGHLHWSRQVTQNDNYLVGCTGKADSQPAACPRTVGDDYDFGASPVLAERSDGRGVLMVGQKSGAVTALDPDRQGRVLWQTQVGLGSALGGVEWGMAADRQTLFVPIADPYAPRDKTKAGMYGLDIGDGRIVWSNAAPAPNCAVAPKGSLINICTSGLSTAPTAIEGAVIEGSLDGVLRAYGARDGKVVWSFDVGQASFSPINGAAPAKGDTMNAGGATVAGGTLFQVSGYQSSNPNAKNLLVAFTVDGK